MKILNIHTSLGMGGTERVAVNFCLGYNSQNVDSRFLVIYGSGPRISELKKNNIIIYDHSETLDCLEKIKRWDPDILHCHRSLVFDVNMVKIIDNIKTENTIVVETNVFSRYDYSKWYKDNIDVSFQLSSWCLWKYNRWKGASKLPHSKIIPNPLLTEKFKRASIEQINNFKVYHKLPLNAFIWSKHTVESFILASKKIKNLYLLLVGPSTKVVDQIKKLPKELKSKTRIIDKIVGDDNLSVCYSSINIFIHSSKIGESFGLVLAESMLCNTPVITLATPFRDNSQIEVVGHGIGGLVANSTLEMADQINYLYDNPSVLDKYRLNARNRIKSRFDFKVIAKELIRFYSQYKKGIIIDSKIDLQELKHISNSNNSKLSVLSLYFLVLLHYPLVNKIIRRINNVKLKARKFYKF